MAGLTRRERDLKKKLAEETERAEVMESALRRAEQRAEDITEERKETGEALELAVAREMELRTNFEAAEAKLATIRGLRFGVIVFGRVWGF